MTHKVFWQTIRHLRGKRSQAAFFIEGSNGVTVKDQDAILNRWRKCFSDPLTQLILHRQKVTRNRLGKMFRLDVNAVIKSLETGKALGEDIRPEMLKAMNMYGVCWLTRVCTIACRTGQAPKRWQISVIILIHKETKENAPIMGAYLS